LTSLTVLTLPPSPYEAGEQWSATGRSHEPVRTTPDFDFGFAFDLSSAHMPNAGYVEKRAPAA
jgi:hypothetical protein